MMPKGRQEGTSTAGWTEDDDLYFEMEFPGPTTVHMEAPDSFGSRSTLDSRDSPTRDSRKDVKTWRRKK